MKIDDIRCVSKTDHSLKTSLKLKETLVQTKELNQLMLRMIYEVQDMVPAIPDMNLARINQLTGALLVEMTKAQGMNGLRIRSLEDQKELEIGGKQ